MCAAMRKPSGRVLANRVDIYRATTVRRGTGYDPTYSATPDVAGVPCSVQNSSRMGGETGTARLTQVNEYDVMFAADYGLMIRDRLVWVDSAGTSHTLYIETSYDNAGRGAAFTVSCTELI